MTGEIAKLATYYNIFVPITFLLMCRLALHSIRFDNGLAINPYRGKKAGKRSRFIAHLVRELDGVALDAGEYHASNGSIAEYSGRCHSELIRKCNQNDTAAQDRRCCR